MVTFQKRHYQFLAEIIREYPNNKDLIDLFVVRLRGTNSQFNAEKFRSACTPKRPKPIRD